VAEVDGAAGLTFGLHDRQCADSGQEWLVAELRPCEHVGDRVGEQAAEPRKAEARFAAGAAEGGEHEADGVP
jgi:hypothetical protein